MPSIGTLREQHLHASLKEWYREPGDLVEVSVEGFVVDLVRGRDPSRGRELIEIQTRSFGSMKRKLDALLDRHAIRVVHPIGAEKWIRKVNDHGCEISRKKSPKRGIVADCCAELVSFPTLLSHPNFTLEVLLVQEEEIRRRDPSAWRSKGWRTVERRLLGVLERVVLAAPEDLVAILPNSLQERFTAADLATALGRSRRLARQVSYCLREAGVLAVAGRTRAGIVYQRT